MHQLLVSNENKVKDDIDMVTATDTNIRDTAKQYALKFIIHHQRLNN